MKSEFLLFGDITDVFIQLNYNNILQPSSKELIQEKEKTRKIMRINIKTNKKRRKTIKPNKQTK